MLRKPRMLHRTSYWSICLVELLLCNVSAHAHENMPEVEIVTHYDNAIGSSESASQGVVQSQRLNTRALLRPAEALEFIPGMVVTQHSGDGKANQYFLRGMNLDHGTDFATSINGVPINLPTHAHGHGYSDLNLLIPELVQNVYYKKGPYFASEGDFSSAGSAQFVYRTQLPRDLLDVTVGQRGYPIPRLPHWNTTANDTIENEVSRNCIGLTGIEKAPKH